MANVKIEQWKSVVGYEGLYFVSDAGRVKSERRLLNPGLSHGRRWQVVLYKDGQKKTHLVARLVAAAFLGPSNGLMVLHRNDVPSDNCVANLYYGTQLQNMQDRNKNGHASPVRGVNCSKAKLTEAQVLEIRKRLAGESQAKLAQEFKVDQKAISDIKLRKSWAWLNAVNEQGV